MKIRMNKTATAKAADGSEIVFGPAGREYSTDDGILTKEMADSLLKKKAAESLSKKRSAKPLEVEENVTE